MSSASSCIIVLVLQFPGEEVQGWARAFPDLSLSFPTLLRSLAITYLPGSASGGGEMNNQGNNKFSRKTDMQL